MLKSMSAVIPPDSYLNQKAFILIRIIRSVLVIITLSFVANMFLQPENVFRYSVILFITWIVSVISLFFAKRDSSYFIAFFYILFLLLMIFGFSWIGGGIKGHGIKVLPIVVLF